MRAVWNGTVLAESADTIVVEGNHYFPPDSIRQEYFSPSRTTTRCPWKGSASYFTVAVGDETLRDAAWAYLDPSPAASEFKGYLAFWRGVQIEESDQAA